MQENLKVKTLVISGVPYDLRDPRVDTLIDDFVDVRRKIAQLTDPKCSVKSVQTTLIDVMTILRGDLSTEQQRRIAAIDEPVESIQSCQTALMEVMRVLANGATPSPAYAALDPETSTTADVIKALKGIPTNEQEVE